MKKNVLLWFQGNFWNLFYETQHEQFLYNGGCGTCSLCGHSMVFEKEKRMTKGDVKGIVFTAVAVLLAGVILHFGRKLPIVKDARDGFGG